MEYPPPEYYFDNIIYNSKYYTSSLDNDILSKEYADSLYLKRTANDVSYGSQTFLSSICCQYIEPALFVNPPVPNNITLYDTLDTGGVLNILNSSKPAVLRINRPITIGYSPSNFTSSSQNGYYGTGTSPLITLVNGTNTTLITMPVLPIGTYILSYLFDLNTSATTSITATGTSFGYSRDGTITNNLNGLYAGIASDVAFPLVTNQKYTSVGIYQVTASNISPRLIFRLSWTGSATSVTVTGTYFFVRIG